MFVIRLIFFFKFTPSLPPPLTSTRCFKIIVDQKIGRYSNLDWRFSGLNHPIVRFFGLVPKSPTHTGLIRVKTQEPNISSMGVCSTSL